MTRDHAPAIRAALERLLAEHVAEPILRSAIGHLLGRGKLFRPRLALSTYEAISSSDATLFIPLACALELTHTFTLIHDDLPCMDDAQLRRGVPSVHIEHDEALAVLAGDALCNLAFHVLMWEDASISDAARVLLARDLSWATERVVEGQVLDLAAEGSEPDLDELLDLHSRKTGALLGVCCSFGAIFADREDLAAPLRRIGERIGVLFQIRDDLLSLEGSEAQAGKTLATDADRAKSTFPRILGHSATVGFAEGWMEDLVRDIHGLGLADPLELSAYAHQAYRRES